MQFLKQIKTLLLLQLVVDECEKCDVHALCPNGHCKCKHGYIGNGYQCEKGKLSTCARVFNFIAGLDFN